MWKLIRYELRGRKTLYVVGLIVMIAMTLYQATRYIGMKEDLAQSAPVSMSVPLTMVLCWVVFYVVMTVINVLTYTQDLYGDTGYLVFSLPLRGAAVLASRIVVLILDTLMTLFGGMASVIILACIAPGLSRQVRPDVIPFLLTGDYWVMCLGVLAVIVSFMTIMFFAVTFGRTLTNSRKHLGTIFSALVVIVILWVSARLSLFIESRNPGITLNLQPWKNLTILGEGSDVVPFPLLSPLFFVALGVLAFVLTSWFMDRKLNL